MRINSLYIAAKRKINSQMCARRDFRTDRHIVVFESDDWGSIRMSNKKDWNELLRMGYAVDKRPYERFDTLESPEDLEALFQVLYKYKDSNGNHPIITANMLMANPDFEKIKNSGFQKYYYEPIAKTYERYFGDTKVMKLMKQGLEAGIFMPQCHGREHFNVAQWMKGLQDGNEDLLTAFKYGICGIAPKASPEKGNQLMKALCAVNDEEQKDIDCIVAEGMGMFDDLWGFKSKTFVAPCYCWNEDTEKVLATCGVRLIQTSRRCKPAYKIDDRCFYSGQRNEYAQMYSIRNCRFEPAITLEQSNVVCSMMKQVEKTFSNKKIAIFSTHRINYVGGISESNRMNTIHQLDRFLNCLLQKYPDVEFHSSDRLIDVLA